MDSLEVVDGLEKTRKLSKIERVLAVTNGSVTQILELWFGEAVRIKTRRQEILPAGETARELDCGEDEEVNFREVDIFCGKRLVLRAKSLTVVSRLGEGFKEDLLRADVPIGRLLIEHAIEARRELLSAKIVDGKLKRKYNLIHGGRILMRIEETFEHL